MNARSCIEAMLGAGAPGRGDGQQAPQPSRADFASVAAVVAHELSDFVDGNPDPYRSRWAQDDDVTIFGGWGAYERGWEEVGPRLDWAATQFSSGDMRQDVLSMGAGGDLGYTVSLERAMVRLAGQPAAAPMVLRVTHIYRRVDGQWKIIHRHADSVTSMIPQTAVLDAA